MSCFESTALPSDCRDETIFFNRYRLVFGKLRIFFSSEREQTTTVDSVQRLFKQTMDISQTANSSANKYLNVVLSCLLMIFAAK